jgi:hypothetical protein
MRRANTTLRAGVFEDLATAERVVERLVAAGFSTDSISVVCPTCAEGDLPVVEHVDPAGEHTPKAAGAGSAIGSLLGGLGVATGVAASGGTGLLVVGPLLGGALAGGIFGGLAGAMAARGLEPEIADFYDQALTRGQILVAVHASDEPGAPPLERAETIFERAGVVPWELREG